MTVLDVGSGMGFFSVATARMVGDQDRVIAVDLSQETLDVLQRRKEKAGVAERILSHECKQYRLGVEGLHLTQ